MMQVQYIIWLSCCFKRMNKDREFTESKTIKQNTKMKKRILGAALLVAIAVAAGWNYQQNKQDVQLSDLALTNVEALASGEGSGDCKWRTGHSSVTGWIAICGSYGVGYSCSCGDIKYY